MFRKLYNNKMRARSAVILSAVAAMTMGKEFLGQMEMYPVAPSN